MGFLTLYFFDEGFTTLVMIVDGKHQHPRNSIFLELQFL